MRRIFDMLFPPRGDEIALRDFSDDDFSRLLSPRLVPVTRPGTVALFPFSEEPIRSAIHEAKYHGTGRAIDVLAQSLADYLRDTDEQAHTIALVPIPLGKTRRKERGFNQSEEIAQGALRHLRGRAREFILETSLLTRIRETVSQVSLPRQKREENMCGAFGAAHPADPTHVYIVIDDVVTTGATLQAAVDALRAAGAVTIVPLALAH
jgi:ComF family protein